MSGNNYRRIVISGTYSTGKTTTSTALSLLTGIPRVDASSAREVVTELYPGMRFQDLSTTELMALGFRRLELRIQAEAILDAQGGFIADGSVLNEWIYGTTRLVTGPNPGSARWHKAVKNALTLPGRPFYRRYLNAYGDMARQRARQNYDIFFHLPVEVPMDPDGHRPVDERYRAISDRQLLHAISELGQPVVTVRGTPEQRLESIVSMLDIPTVMDIDVAVKEAMEIVRSSRERVQETIIAQQQPHTLGRKIKFATRV
ncbi:ATP/GTP-binding protein [Nocardia araoensis]|uniref:ATP/GTP-binding protein n=1 Tax=Nocardia araoensis TaxID=228600 RepID=UPI0002EF4365|nr:ATP-binding protein [Nocardia araoensis]